MGRRLRRKGCHRVSSLSIPDPSPVPDTAKVFIDPACLLIQIRWEPRHHPYPTHNVFV